MTSPPKAVSSLDDLARQLQGELVRPGDPAYDDTRRVWNGMIDLRPAAVARCYSTEDVQASVLAARAAELPLAVRGGGHNVAGLGTIDGGLVIDLGGMRSVSVDAELERARVAGGALLGDLDAATQAHGLVVPTGVVSETGVAGLTLSGGLGWLRRRWGATSDNLIGATLVTAAGDIVEVSDASDPELLWGLRGGGGNFGVVTELVFDAHRLGPEVAFLFVLYPLDAARHVVAQHEHLVEASGDDVGTLVILGHVRASDDVEEALHGRPYVALVGMYAGPAAEGEEVLNRFRRLGQPLADFSGVTPYVEAQTVFDTDYPAGRRYYWKSTNLGAMPTAVVDVLIEHTRSAPSKDSTIDVWLNGGAMARAPDAHGAFRGGGARYLVNPEADWERADDDDANIAWARGVLADLAPHTVEGAYLNFPGLLEEGPSLARTSHGSGFERLAALKARLDPENVFSRNVNVEPTRAG